MYEYIPVYMYVHMQARMCADHQARKGIVKEEEEILREGWGKRETRMQTGDYCQGVAENQP